MRRLYFNHSGRCIGCSRSHYPGRPTSLWQPAGANSAAGDAGRPCRPCQISPHAPPPTPPPHLSSALRPWYSPRPPPPPRCPPPRSARRRRRRLRPSHPPPPPPPQAGRTRLALQQRRAEAAEGGGRSVRGGRHGRWVRQGGSGTGGAATYWGSLGDRPTHPAKQQRQQQHYQDQDPPCGG